MRLRRHASVAAAVLGSYCAVLLLSREWQRNWGATSEERTRPLPGDELADGWLGTRAITIKAPAERVWQWLVQIGQDRAGFYSYTVLENLFLAGMRNSDRIHPEWQNLSEGDLVRLASKKVYGDLPLVRVAAIRKNHYLVLEGWGAFVLERIDAAHTRLLIRTHAGGKITGPLSNFLFWDPAHFVMERGMMRGIRRRAEQEG